ncbi:hypothetical protein [Streptomyces sp. NPDC018610]|uniref:hypothetical protein n=1 Tax=Streptomyces sp. NPDC018610 TaxID=3365049 RepID=UPI0037B94E01
MLRPPASPFPSSPPPPSSPASAPPVPHPPGVDTPATCEVPHFAPVRVRGGRYGPRRLVRHRRRAVAAGLAVTAAALVAAGPRPGADPPGGGPARGHPAHTADAPPGSPGGLGGDAGRTVTAPVRIADAETVRLLRPGDRVDVIAAGDPAADGTARVLARGARVAEVPRPVTGNPETGPTADGALIALSVPRSTAARLAGAGTTTRLAVTLW